MKYKLLFLFIFSSAVLSAQNLPIKYDHSGRVNAISHSGTTLISGGSDGAINVRSGANYELIRRIQVGYLAIEAIAVNPVWPVAAILQSDSIDAFKLTVWNYEKGEMLYSYRLQQKPLFIQYSPSGKYLIYSNPRVNGLTIIDHQNGQRRPWLTETGTITPAALLSADDRLMAAYSPSGAISIYKIQTGEEIKRIPCLPNLENPMFLAEGKILIATNRSTIMAINGQNGKVFNSTELEGIIRIAADNPPGRLALYCYQDGYTFVYDWNFMKRDAPINIDPNRDFSETSSLFFMQGDILCGQTDGTLLRYSKEGARESLSQLHLKPYTGIAVNENKLTLATADDIQTFPIELLLNGDSPNSQQNTIPSVKNPVEAESGLCRVKEEAFLVFNKKGEKGTIYYLDTLSGESSPVSETDAPILTIKQGNNGYLGLDESGTSFLLSQEELEKVFNYTSFGTRDISLISSSKLIAGRAKDSLFNSSMVIVDAGTGETVPLDTADLITFDISYNEELLSLYTLGVEDRNGRIRTVLKVYRGGEFQRVETLSAIPGEDHKASVLYDPYTSKLYTTLGTAGIRIIQWGGFTTNQHSGHIPSRLAVNRQLLFSLNQDGSVSAWYKHNGRAAFTLYRFENGSWVVTRPGLKIESGDQWADYLVQ